MLGPDGKYFNNTLRTGLPDTGGRAQPLEQNQRPLRHTDRQHRG
jgi:hypothetical protein